MTSPNRQPRGTTEGGQFSKQHHDEAEIYLTGSESAVDTGPEVSFSEAKAMSKLWFSVHDGTADFALHGRVSDDGVSAWKAKRQQSAESEHPFAPTAVAEIDKVISYLEARISSHGPT